MHVFYFLLFIVSFFIYVKCVHVCFMCNHVEFMGCFSLVDKTELLQTKNVNLFAIVALELSIHGVPR